MKRNLMGALDGNCDGPGQEAECIIRTIHSIANTLISSQKTDHKMYFDERGMPIGPYPQDIKIKCGRKVANVLKDKSPWNYSLSTSLKDIQVHISHSNGQCMLGIGNLGKE